MLYRTDDLARWGAGTGVNLAPVEIDTNFWELAERLVAVEATAGSAANGIASIAVTGSQMTVWLDDGTALGPYTLPTAMIRYRGDWTAATAYVEMDLVTVPGTGVYRRPPEVEPAGLTPTHTTIFDLGFDLHPPDEATP